jgi:hypothetical protein
MMLCFWLSGREAKWDTWFGEMIRGRPETELVKFSSALCMGNC